MASDMTTDRHRQVAGDNNEALNILSVFSIAYFPSLFSLFLKSTWNDICTLLPHCKTEQWNESSLDLI